MQEQRFPYDLVIFRREHQCHLLRKEACSSFEVSVGITEEGEVVRANVVADALSRKERVKPRRHKLVTAQDNYQYRNTTRSVSMDFNQHTIKSEMDPETRCDSDITSENSRNKQSAYVD
ncbi:hypothetical protein Tco_0649616 [Tanacetum coccineum]